MKKIISGVLAFWLCFAISAHAQKFDELGKKPQMGWNSWNCFANEVSADKVKRPARRFSFNTSVIGRSGLKKFEKFTLLPPETKNLKPLILLRL
jgi:hypothetical protein